MAAAVFLANSLHWGFFASALALSRKLLISPSLARLHSLLFAVFRQFVMQLRFRLRADDRHAFFFLPLSPLQALFAVFFELLQRFRQVVNV